MLKCPAQPATFNLGWRFVREGLPEQALPKSWHCQKKGVVWALTHAKIFGGFDIVNRGQPKVIMAFPKWQLLPRKILLSPKKLPFTLNYLIFTPRWILTPPKNVNWWWWYSGVEEVTKDPAISRSLRMDPIKSRKFRYQSERVCENFFHCSWHAINKSPSQLLRHELLLFPKIFLGLGRI